MVMMVRRMIFTLALFSLLALPSCAAGSNVYLALRPDTTFCITENLGGQGTGEYTITIDDPGFPDSPWVDTHSASFFTGPDNPVIVPICFDTLGRRRGSEATLVYTLKTPRKNITTNYGICVSNFEDYDTGIVKDNPCRAVVSDMEPFSFDIMLPERYVSVGEIAEFNLLLSSDFFMDITLEKESGPKMDIEETELKMPGEFVVKMSLTAPADEGEYPFTISAKRSGCDASYCEKSVSGTIYVTGTGRSQFDASLQPMNKNVVGIKPVKYYITIKNYEQTQDFSIKVETDEGLICSFPEVPVKIGKGSTGTYNFLATPKSQDHEIHKITMTVENENGVKKVAEAMLTVDEAISNINTGAENDMISDSEADAMENEYASGADLEKWEFMEGDDGGFVTPGGTEETPFSFMWMIVITAVVAAIGAAGFYIYKKSHVTQEISSPYYEET